MRSGDYDEYPAGKFALSKKITGKCRVMFYSLMAYFQKNNAVFLRVKYAGYVHPGQPVDKNSLLALWS